MVVLYRHDRGGVWRRVAWLVTAIHTAILVAMVPDYSADNDLGFHI